MKKCYLPTTIRLLTVLVIALVGFVGQSAVAQTTFFWRNDQNPPDNASWLNTSPHYFWNGAPAVPGGNEILFFDGAAGTTMTNNLTATSRFAIRFGSGGAARTINGTTANTFFDFGGTWPFVENLSTNIQTINFPIIVGSGGTFNLILRSQTGPLDFGSTFNHTTSKILFVFGNNSGVDASNRFVRLRGVVSGNGTVAVSEFGVLRMAAAHTYTGQTQINNGEMWIESGGGISSSSGIFVGDGGQPSNVAKLWLAPTTGGLTFPNNFTINPGNLSTREVGGLNTSGTHTFSGNITINSSNLLLTAQAGGSVSFTGILSGSNGFTKSGAGLVQLGGANTFTGPININAGTLRLGATNTIPNTANISFNTDGVVLSSGASAGFSDQMGTLDLEGNTTIALGTGNHTLTFANSSGVAWNLTKTLTVTGWTGTAGSSGTAGKIVVGTGGLTAAQLARISFSGYAPGAMIVSGEVVPVGTSISSFAVASPGSGTSGYVGNLITLTGTGFTNTSALSVGGTTVSTFTVVNDNTLTFNAINASGTISLTSPSGSATSSTSYTNLGFISTQNGDWNTSSTWLGGSLPVANAPVWIAHQVSVNANVANAAGALVIASGGTLQPGAGNLTALQVNVNAGGTVGWTSTGTLTIAVNGSLTNSGTINAGSGTVSFAGAGSISGTMTLFNLTINAGTLTNSATLTIAGQFSINGGNISAAPIYALNSTLQYNLGYTRFNEWLSTGVGTIGVTPGYPHHVTVQAGSFNLRAAAGNAALACNGTLTVNGTASFNDLNFPFTAASLVVNSGGVLNGNTNTGNITITQLVSVAATGLLNLGFMSGDFDADGSIQIALGGSFRLSQTSFADLFLAGNFTNNGTFNHNDRGVFLDGSTNQTISGLWNTAGVANNFPFLIINKPSGVVILGSPVLVTNTLTLTAGLVQTSTTELLTVFNSAVGAISGGSSTSYIVGPLARQLPASLASGSSYFFPVGKGGNYYPFTAVNPTTGSGSIAVTVESFNANAGGSLGAGVSAMSSTEYWRLSATGNFTGTAVSLNRSLAIGSFNVVARSTTETGAYDQLGGTVSGTAINGSNSASGISQFYRYATAVAPGVFTLTGGATGCAATGLTYGLSSSQTGASYQLVRDGSVNVGSPVPGTGAAISFGVQNTGGVYTVVAFWALVPATTTAMTGSSTLTATGTWIGGTSGSWNTATNWCGGVPVSTSNVLIPAGVSVTIDAASAANTVTIGTGASVTFTTDVTLQIRAGGSITNNGTFTQTTGSVALLGNATIGGSTACTFHNFQVQSGTATFSTVPTIRGTLQILASGAVNTAPIYGPNSVLHYNTGGSYNMASEWTSNSLTAGLGVPFNVLITNTALSYAGSERGIGGNLTLNTGATMNLSNASGATLSIGGNYTWNTSATSPVNNNGQSIIFNGPNTSRIAKPIGPSTVVFFDYLVINKTGSAQVILEGPPAATTVQINAFDGNANARLRLLNGTLNLNGQVFNLNAVNANGVANVSVGGGSQRIIASSPTSGGVFSITGAVTGVGFATTTFSSESGGSTLLFDNTVTIQVGLGVDFGPTGLTLINTNLQINTNGFVIGNSPDYGDAATLIYNSGPGGYNRHFEWNTNVPGPGFPSNIIVQNNTPVNLDFYSNTGLGTSARIEIQAGSSMTMGSMANSLTAGTDLILNGALTLSSTAGGDLNVGRSWSRGASGVFNQNNRNVTFNGSESGTITAVGGQVFSHMYLNKNQLAQSITLMDSVNIVDVIGFTRGTLDLSNRNVTLLSTDTKTARVDTVKTPANINLLYSGTGAFVVQRYLPINTTNSSRRWRLLTAPVSTLSAPTIHAAWQEGQSNSNRLSPINNQPGFGTTITRFTTAANGFDQGSTNNSSIFALVNGIWTALSSTNTVSIRDFDAYMLFVRGDRSIVVSNQFVTPTPTTLRVKGRLNIGPVIRTLAASGFQALGNPYASAISFNDVVFNGVSPRTTAGRSFYLWDPKMAGSANVGGLVTCTSLGNGKFAVTANGSGYPTDNSFDGLIESGAGFLVQAAGGSFQFQENAKWAVSSTVGIASRPQQAGNTLTDMQQITVNLKIGQGAAAQVTDGVIGLMKPGFASTVDQDDARKMFSFSGAERLSLMRDSMRLSVELHDAIQDKDTFFLHVARLNRLGYELEVIDHNSAATQVAFLEDRFLATKTRVPRNDTLRFPFDVNADPASGQEHRFHIVFRDAVRFGTLEAQMPERDGLLQIAVLQEFEVQKYVLERSSGGRAYEVVGELASRGNAELGGTYSWIDPALAPGQYLYRVKAILKSGEVVYSNRVTLTARKTTQGVYVFPNPARSGKLSLQWNALPAGLYELRILDATGAIVHRDRVSYSGGFTSMRIEQQRSLAGGWYTVEVLGSSGARYRMPVLIQP